MIKAVFFDLGWTLVRPASGDWTFNPLFFRLYPQLKLSDLKQERFVSALNKAYQPLLENPGMKDVEEQIRRFTGLYQTFLEETGLPYEKDTAMRLAEDISTNDENMFLLDSAAETLAYLKEHGYYLGVISDTWPNIVTQLEYLDIRKYFDHVTYSYLLSTSKPSPMMYQDALAHCPYKPRETIFADDLRANLFAAEKFHINAVRSMAGSNEEESYFPVIRKPADLLKML